MSILPHRRWVTRLGDYVNAPADWRNLRHERERHVYREAFWRGFDFGLRFAQQCRDDLAAADDDTRRLYAAVGGRRP